MINRLQYAMKDNKLVHILEVESGLGCSCYCPQCGSKLVAKKGKRKIYHFAHYNSEDCHGSIETSLHMLAKEIISEEKRVKLPELYLEFPNSYKEKELIHPERIIDVDSVYLEKRIDNIIPDIIIDKRGYKLLIEIYVTHDVDENKLTKIKNAGFSTLSIDLNDKAKDITKADLKKIIVDETNNKRWIYNRVENDLYKMFEQKARMFEQSTRSGVFCPQYKYGWKGKSSARIEDCIECEYCFSYYGIKNCLGYSGVSKIKDLNNPALEEKSKKLINENKIKNEWLQGTQCEKCRQGYMKLNVSKYGKFLGCSNYPNCNNTIKL